MLITAHFFFPRRRKRPELNYNKWDIGVKKNKVELKTITIIDSLHSVCKSIVLHLGQKNKPMIDAFHKKEQMKNFYEM